MKSRHFLLISSIVASLFCLPAMAQPGLGMGGGMQGMGAEMKPGMGPGMGMSPGMGPGMGAGMMPQEGGPRMRGPRDCKASPHPEACEARRAAHQQAYEACKDKAAGPERRQCIHDRMPPPDCSKSPNPQRCEQHQKARELCQSKAGPERKSCMREALRPKPGETPALPR